MPVLFEALAVDAFFFFAGASWPTNAKAQECQLGMQMPTNAKAHECKSPRMRRPTNANGEDDGRDDDDDYDEQEPNKQGSSPTMTSFASREADNFP